MGAVTLNLPSDLVLVLASLNPYPELLTKCGLGRHPPGKQLRKLIAGPV